MFSLFQRKNAANANSFVFFGGAGRDGAPLGTEEGRHHLSPTGPSPTTKTKSIETLRH
jgi:hypothetical protein